MSEVGGNLSGADDDHTRDAGADTIGSLDGPDSHAVLLSFFRDVYYLPFIPRCPPP